METPRIEPVRAERSENRAEPVRPESRFEPRGERPTGTLRGERERNDRAESRDRGERSSDARLGPTRPRDFASWSPPAEAGDDEPIIPNRKPGTPDEPTTLVFIPDSALVELFVGVGRRDGARAQDLLRALVEQAGIDKDNVKRIRVRDRHTFVAVRKEDAQGAISKLSGQPLCGKASVLVEIARDQRVDEPAN